MSMTRLPSCTFFKDHRLNYSIQEKMFVSLSLWKQISTLLLNTLPRSWSVFVWRVWKSPKNSIMSTDSVTLNSKSCICYIAKHTYCDTNSSLNKNWFNIYKALNHLPHSWAESYLLSHNSADNSPFCISKY